MFSNISKNIRIGQFIIFSHVSHLDKLIFAKNLAVMVKSGLTIPEALDVAYEQAISKRMKKVVGKLIKKTSAGYPLHKGLSDFPDDFDTFFINIVRIGEESGTLEENLNYLAQQLEKESTLRSKVRSAMIYPILVLVITFVLGGFLAYVILPKLINVFNSLNFSLPLSTRILLWLAAVVRDHGAIILASIIFTIFFIRFLLKSRLVRPYWHRFILFLPFFGQLNRNVNMVRIARNLGLLLKSGLPIHEALNITSNNLISETYKSKLNKVKSNIQKGESISLSLETFAPTIFPKVVDKIIAVGEKTGKLEESLLYLADFYEKEVDAQIKNLSVILEPALLIFIGLVVAFIVLAIITPIYKFTGSLRK